MIHCYTVDVGFFFVIITTLHTDVLNMSMYASQSEAETKPDRRTTNACVKWVKVQVDVRSMREASAR